MLAMTTILPRPEPPAMFIIGDESKSNGRIPWVTFSLIALNIIVYSTQCFLGDAFTRGFSLVPKEISTLKDLTKPETVRAKVPSRVYFERGQRKIQFREVMITVPQAPGPFPIFLTLVTSMFLHGGLIHLLGNMWFLVVFGRNVECALDHGRFLLFYIACGVMGGLVYTASDAWSVIPCLGASGAISGVMGAYVAIHPLNPISIWFGLYFGVIRLPAFVVVGVWFLFQYVAAFQSLEFAGTNLGGTAYWDHLGGFLTGVTTIWGTVAYLKRKQANGCLKVDNDFQAAPTEQDDELGAADPGNTTIKSTPKLEAQVSMPAIDPFRACLPETTAGRNEAEQPANRN
jgi:membrane associated rhomboid family serine protease